MKSSHALLALQLQNKGSVLCDTYVTSANGASRKASGTVRPAVQSQNLPPPQVMAELCTEMSWESYLPSCHYSSTI